MACWMAAMTRAVRARAVGVQSPQVDQVGPRRHAGICSAGKEPLPPMIPATCVPCPYKSYFPPLEFVVAVPVKSW